MTTSFFQIDGGHFRLYDPQNDPVPLTGPSEPASVELTTPRASLDEVEPETHEFAYEHDLRDFLVKNLHLIEPGLKLYEDEGIRGVEFPVGGRYIDILALDRSNDYVVIELKVSRGYDRVVGQLLSYITWIRKHHADPGQHVRGVIIARTLSEELCLACCDLPSITLFEYQMSISLRKVEVDEEQRNDSPVPRPVRNG